MPRKYQKIAEQFQQAKDLARWYDSNFMLRAERSHFSFSRARLMRLAKKFLQLLLSEKRFWKISIAGSAVSLLWQ